MKKIGLILIFLMLLGSVNALVIEYPRTLAVEKEFKEFEVKISNDSGQEKSLAFEFIAPSTIQTSSLPSTVKAGEEVSLIVKIFNDEKFWNSTYISSLKVDLGLEQFSKKIETKYLKPVAETSTPIKPTKDTTTENKNSDANKDPVIPAINSMAEILPISGLVSFLNSGNAFNFGELVLDAFLVLVAAVLLIAFIARFVKRVRVHK
ncbi:MAG: hypothetical protein Q7K42_00770 [Candidatus Diapherotrites archaeon]|nr:hypothetical protein [Candidatus Diapherotrites archaeon]